MKKIFKKMTDFIRVLTESEQDREYRFLSQAQSHSQLEELQRIWDREYKRSGWR
jgi:hypothetical protein